MDLIAAALGPVLLQKGACGTAIEERRLGSVTQNVPYHASSNVLLVR